MLHKSFITPLDRDDIHRLITKMDDILDMMEDAAQTVSLYDIQHVTPEARRLAELVLACTHESAGSDRSVTQHEKCTHALPNSAMKSIVWNRMPIT